MIVVQLIDMQTRQTLVCWFLVDDDGDAERLDRLETVVAVAADRLHQGGCDVCNR